MIIWVYKSESQNMQQMCSHICFHKTLKTGTEYCGALMLDIKAEHIIKVNQGNVQNKTNHISQQIISVV